MAVEAGQAEVVVVYRSLCQGQFARIGRDRAESAARPRPPWWRPALETDALQAFTAPFGDPRARRSCSPCPCAATWRCTEPPASSWATWR